MKNLIFGILVVFISVVNAQEPQNIFEEANSQYQKEAYTEAIISYKKVIDQGLESAELYFNLGNSYYKANQIAEAIYNYEKALVLNPSFKDAKVNLAYANRSIIDSIKILPKSIFEKLNDAVFTFFSYNTWAKFAVGASLVSGVLWLLFFFSTQPGIKKTYFTLGIITTLLCLITLGITSQQYNYTTKIKQAIVFSDEVAVKNAPRENASEVFTLHEGTKIVILDEVGDWQKIKIADGQVGWLLKNNIKFF